ncbi:hypothetical protein, partial [Faecalibaculum rodentium]
SEEKARLQREMERLEKEIMRGEKMLSNPGFTSKAPAAKVAAETQKLENYRTEFTLAKEQFAKLDKIQTKK